jgi:hypothetical protein
VPCPSGEYQPSEGQIACITCPAGRYTPELLPEFVVDPTSDCRWCAENGTTDERDTCSISADFDDYDGYCDGECDCIPEWYSEEPGRPECMLCPAGYECAADGTITICEFGMYSILGDDTCRTGIEGYIYYTGSPDIITTVQECPRG